MRNVSYSVEKIKTHVMFSNFFPEDPAVDETMWKYFVEPDRPQMKIWLVRIAFWIPKATDTQSKYMMIKKSLCT
jgi:hypothetical protein